MKILQKNQTEEIRLEVYRLIWYLSVASENKVPMFNTPGFMELLLTIKDESSDGAVRGAIWALAVALIPNQGWTSGGDYLRGVAMAFIVFPTAGYLLDAAESNRQPLYRAPSTSSPTLNISFRF